MIHGPWMGLNTTQLHATPGIDPDLARRSKELHWSGPKSRTPHGWSTDVDGEGSSFFPKQFTVGVLS